MYDRPPMVVIIALSFPSGAYATAPILAAPGAGLAYRIVGVHVIAWEGIAAGTAIDGLVRSTSGAPVGWVMVNATSPTDSLPIPGPGIQLPVNDGLEINAAANVATNVIRLSVSYYIDAVS